MLIGTEGKLILDRFIWTWRHKYFMFCWPITLYNLVNKANLVHNLFLVYLLLVYLSISTCFGQICVHHQEKQLYLCDTWYLLFCVDDCLVCRSICSCIPDSQFVFCTADSLVCRMGWNGILHTRQSSIRNNKYQVSPKDSCFSWWWAHSRPKHVEIDKYAKNKLCTKLVFIYKT